MHSSLYYYDIICTFVHISFIYKYVYIYILEHSTQFANNITNTKHSNQYKERDDPRSQSFLHLCHLLGDVMREETLPALILLENVVGFEKDWGGDGDVDVQDGDVNVDSSGGDAKDKEKQSSKDEQREKSSFQSWRKALSKRDYHVAHFHLDPTHVGLPNNRPRHYTVAFRPGALRQRLGKEDGASFFNNHQHNIMGERYAPLFRKELLGKPPIIHDEKSLASPEKDGTVLPAAIPCIGSMLDTDLAPHASTPGNLSSKKHQLVQIPEKVRTSSSSWCFDIVTSQHHLSACFTHSYGKFVRGTGSILYTGPLVVGEEGKGKIASSLASSLVDKEEAQHCNAAIALSANAGDSDNEKDATPPSIGRFELARPEERKFDASWSDDLDWDQLRYFSGNEIARLMGFPVADPPAVACDGVCPGKKMLTADHGTSTTLEAKSEETPPMFTEEEKQSYRKFSFPPESTMKQQWKLLGNSLNVRVAACVAQIGIEMMLNE